VSRVLHLITSLAQGGAERQMTYLCCGLARLGWDVQVGFLETDRLHDDVNLSRLHASGVSTHHVRNAGPYDPVTPLRFVRLIRRVRPDVVQTWIPMVDVTGGLAARWTRTPWVMSERNTPDYYAFGPKFRLRGAIVRGASAVVSNSRPAERYWAGRLPAAVVRRVVPNALPLEEIRSAASHPEDDFGIGDDRAVVLFAGRMNEQKNVRVLLPALERVVRETDAVALVCGVGELSGWVDDFVRERGLSERIRVVGFVRSLWPWMRRAAVFVSVSRFEGMPNTVMEAAAIGCPLVISAIPHHLDLFDDESAVFVEPGDPEHIARAIVDSLRDRADARSRAERAEKKADAWSIDRAAAHYAELYEQLIARTPA
jgi:glycosyltransferase involved in cell wall biosynthesis